MKGGFNQEHGLFTPFDGGVESHQDNELNRDHELLAASVFVVGNKKFWQLLKLMPLLLHLCQPLYFSEGLTVEESEQEKEDVEN